MRSMVWTACLIAAVAVFVLLMPVPFQGRGWGATGDLVHAPLFGCLSFAVMSLLDRLRPLRDNFARLTARGIVVVVVMSSLGGLIEIVQQRIGRSASWHDAISNALGSSAAVFCYLGWRWHRFRPDQKYRSRALFMAAGCFLALSWYTPVMVLRDVVNVERKFPLLASFETRAEMGRFWFEGSQGIRKPTDATDGRYSLELTCKPIAFPRVSLIELHSDWSQAEALEVDVRLVTPQVGSVTFVIKVVEKENGGAGDSFRGTWTLEPGGMKRIRITREAMLAGPADRSLDLSQIEYVDFGLVDPETTTQLRIDRIRIVR